MSVRSCATLGDGHTLGAPLALPCPLGLLPGEDCLSVLGEDPLSGGWRA